MSSSKTSAASTGGLGIGGTLLVVFIVLKCAGVSDIADWSWFWVIVMPFLISIGITLGVLALILGFFGLAALVVWIAKGFEALFRREDKWARVNRSLGPNQQPSAWNRGPFRR